MPRKPIKVGVNHNRQILAKTRKYSNRTITETINPIKPKFEDSSNNQLHFACGLPLPHSKSNMADGRHLENSYDVITRHPVSQ